MMKPIERIRSVLAGQMPDRVPASFWFHFPAGQTHGEASVKAHLEYYHQVKPDFLKIMNENHYLVKVPIKNPADWRKLKPAPINSEFFQAQLDEIKQITDVLQGECLTTTTIFNPFASGNHASGGLVTEHLKADPQSVHIGLATIAESLAEFSLACLEAGADGIYFSAQGGEADRFSEHDFLKFIKPHDLTVLGTIREKGELNIIHICGEKIRLHLYCDYPGQVFNWAVSSPENLSLQSGKHLFNRTILGGLDNRGVIVAGKPKEIESAVHAIIRSIGPMNLIIGADCTLPTDIDRNNIRLAIEATGTFPIAE